MSDLIQNVIYVAIILLFLYIINKTIVLYSKLNHYPTGVFPIPIFGNILSLAANLNRNPVHYFIKLKQKYGNVITFWLGSEPVIIINDYDVAKVLTNKTEFSDRLDKSIFDEFNDLLGEKSTAFMNHDDQQKVLRKVSIEAVRKYLLTNKLTETLREIVTETAHIMMEKECGKQFIPFEYIDSMIVRLLIRTTFGEKVSIDSKVIKQLIKTFESLQENFFKIILSGFFPIIKILQRKSERNSIGKQTSDLMRRWYHNSLKSYHSESTETLSHFVNSAKLRYLSVKQNKMYEKYLSDENLIGTMFTLFFAGSDTTHYTFKWMLLLMAYYPEMQKTMRDEVIHIIGDKYPDICDKDKCHFVNAFVCETLRFRNVTPFGVFHRTKCDTNIGEKLIPKGITIVINQYLMLNDPKYWTNPEIFNPKRFLNSDNCFDKTHLPAFIPFSTGKRMCIGDKFAINMLFLTLTCLLQATNGYHFSVANQQNDCLEPKTFGIFLEPKAYQILIVKDE